MKPELSPEYLSYLASAEWDAFKQVAKEDRDWCCERCGMFTLRLDVHHLHYFSFGHETLDDVQVLCRSCHDEADRERREEVADARHERAFETYCEKKYGYVDDMHREEFEEWLERKQECDDYY